MSAISDFHTVVPFTASSKPSDETQRLCVIHFKTPKDKKDDPTYKKPESLCISIPMLKIHVTPSNIETAMQECFEDLQDALIRKQVLIKQEAGEAIINFHKDQIGFDAIAVYAAEVAASGKMTKEMIGDWFDTDVADNLTLALANAMKLPEKPSSDEEKKLAAAVTLYRNTFSSLAAPKAGLSKKVAEMMQKALAQAGDKEDRIYRSINAKITNALEDKEPELIGL